MDAEHLHAQLLEPRIEVDGLAVVRRAAVGDPAAQAGEADAADAQASTSDMSASFIVRVSIGRAA